MTILHQQVLDYREPVPDGVFRACSIKEIFFGKDYILPKPFAPRLIERIPLAVVKATR